MLTKMKENVQVAAFFLHKIVVYSIFPVLEYSHVIIKHFFSQYLLNNKVIFIKKFVRTENIKY